ncbi:MAG: tol-pal system protein YbgF [Pseudomonadota bacterium]
MMHLPRLLFCAALAIAAAPVAAQSADSRTLADIRQDLTVLYVEIQRLNRELSTTGAAGTPPAGASVLERVDLIERELQRLTELTEQLDFRVQEIVRDGTNRVGDLEFRLCEVEPGCDIADLSDTPSLGGEAPTEAPAAPVAPSGGPQLAVGEQADFDRARQALDDGRYGEAAQMFGRHSETYPGGPLTGEANFLRGEALAALGETAPAARAYLEAFSQAPEGVQAPQALLKLGQSLAVLGQTQDACVTLGEVQVRFPGSGAALTALSDLTRLGCG